MATSGIITNKNKGDYSINRGEIYYVYKTEEEAGSVQQGGRPAIIVSNDANNTHSDCVEIVFLTTKEKTYIPTHVEINSCSRKSIALCEQILTVSKSRLGDYISTISAKELLDIEDALMISIGLESRLEAVNTFNTQMQYELEKAEQKAMDFQNMYDNLKAHYDLQIAKATEKANITAAKHKTERDVYKRMYEQVLKMLVDGKADTVEVEQ